MPIYEYRCQKCGHQFEKLVRSSTSLDDLKCPRCGERYLERLMSVFGIAGAAGGTSSGGASCAPVGGG